MTLPTPPGSITGAAAAPAGVRSGIRSGVRAVLAPLTQARTWRSVCYLLVATPLSIGWLLPISTGLLIGTVTSIIGVGIAVLIATLALVRVCADVDRRLINSLLGAHVAGAVPARRQRLDSAWARELVLGARTWRSLGWLLFRGVAGVLALAGMIIAIVVLVALLAVPFRDGYLQWGDQWRSPSGWSTAWTIPVGLIGLLGCLHLMPLIADVQVRAAVVLLSPDAAEERDALQADAARNRARAELARDLHDSVGHALTVVALQAEAAQVRLLDDPRAAGLAMSQIAETARAALMDLDAALAALRDDSSPRRPVASLTELTGLLDRAARAGLAVDLQISGDLTTLPAAVSAVGFRVVQEACTNVLRHAGAKPTVVAISTTHDAVRIEIRNPIAAPVRAGGPLLTMPRTGAGHGLTGLRERVRIVGGQLRAGPTPDGSRWDVVATFAFATVPVAGDQLHGPGPGP